MAKRAIKNIKWESQDQYISDLEDDVHGQQQRVYKTVKELNISELSDGKGIN
jgi:hypothetical protein